MTTIVRQAWIVSTITGEYEDVRETIVKVCLTEVGALEFVERYEAALDAAGLNSAGNDSRVNDYEHRASCEPRFGHVDYTGMTLAITGPFEVEP